MRKSKKLEEIRRHLERLDVLLTVRDPGNALSADAYNGLRKSIVHAASSRRAHISHLLSLRDSLKRGASLELINDHVQDFLTELGVKEIDDLSNKKLFEFEAAQTGIGEWRCVKSAIVCIAESNEVMVIRLGQAAWHSTEPDPGSPDEENPDEEVDGSEDIESSAEEAPLEDDK